jgi:hypothetical protein
VTASGDLSTAHVVWPCRPQSFQGGRHSLKQRKQRQANIAVGAFAHRSSASQNASATSGPWEEVVGEVTGRIVRSRSFGWNRSFECAADAVHFAS